MTISRESTSAIKGLCILLIVLHHYTQNYGYLPEILNGVGPVACSAFFFISGYGLAVNCGDRKKWGARLKKLYFPFLLCNALYMILLYCILGAVANWKVMITDFIGITLINKHCWFMQILLIYYLIVATVDIHFNNNRKLLASIFTLVGGGNLFCINTFCWGDFLDCVPCRLLYKR